MKRTALLLALATALMLKAGAETTNTTTPLSPPAEPPTAPAPPVPAAAPNPDANAAPGDGFPAKRYEPLWTKSPFAVATPDAIEESPDYSLVGVAQVDGVYYASLIQKQNQQHFLLSSAKPSNGLTLNTITRGKDASDISAALTRDGQPITLKLEAAPMMAPSPVMPSASGIALPTPGVTQNIPMPGANQQGNTTTVRPLIRIHRPAIHLPPRATQESAPPPPPPAPAK